jgi:hypothetical protein
MTRLNLKERTRTHAHEQTHVLVHVWAHQGDVTNTNFTTKTDKHITLHGIYFVRTVEV